MRQSLTFLLLLFTLACSAQRPGVDTYFPKPVEVGSYYYPEHWNPTEWERDLKKMADLGFTFTHFGEFAWSQLEPSEGNFDFTWLDKALELAAKNDLKVVMCTPTPTPPAWLTQKHPEILVVNEQGRQMQHGSRQQGSWSSRIYREYIQKVVTKLGERYGNDSRVWGWQLDNEPSHYNTFYDYNEAAQDNFQSYLKEKYASIEELNKRWGNDFWSQNYNDFSQIRIPNQAELVQPPNPHALLDFQEFNNSEMTDFLKFQADILKKTCSPEQWITTNYMMAPPHIDPFPGKDNLDFACYTKYPISSYDPTDSGPLGFRLGAAYSFIFAHQFCESINGYTGVMELQPGQVNWGQWNSQPLPGAVRMWIWHAYAMGSKFICNYRFRQPVYGNEQYHQGIIQPDGETVALCGQDYVRATNELAQTLKKSSPGAPLPKALLAGRTAIVWDRKSVLDMMNFPHTSQWDPMSQFFDYIKTLESMGLPYEFVTAEEPIDPKEFPFMIIPSVQLTDDNMITQWKNYAQKGGHIIMTCRTGQKNRDSHLWRDKYQAPIMDLMGAEVTFYDHLPPDRKQTVRYKNQHFTWGTWGDILKVTDKNTSILGTHEDGFYKGHPTVIRKNNGKGDVTYIGTRSENHALESAIIKDLYQKSGIAIDNLPPYVFKCFRDNLWIVLNYSSTPYTPSLPEKAKILLGTTQVAPGEVLIWKE